MNTSVITRELRAPAINERELLRYAGGSPGECVKLLADEVIRRYTPLFSYRVVYLITDVRVSADRVELGTISITSRTLATALSGCDRVCIVAATVGSATDRAVSALSVTSPARAHMLDSFGTERVESLLDLFEAELKEEYGVKTKPRVSAGYGDIPLELQRDIFKALTPESRIGLYLNDSLLMTPRKSVTAFIGIKSEQ